MADRPAAKRPRGPARSHTVLLVQFSASTASRSWSEYDSLGSALNGVVKMFETSLKKDAPDEESITYDLSELLLLVLLLGCASAAPATTALLPTCYHCSYTTTTPTTTTHELTLPLLLGTTSASCRRTWTAWATWRA